MIPESRRDAATKPASAKKTEGAGAFRPLNRRRKTIRPLGPERNATMAKPALAGKRS